MNNFCQVCTCGYGSITKQHCPVHDEQLLNYTTSSNTSRDDLEWIVIPGGAQEFFSGQLNLDMDSGARPI